MIKIKLNTHTKGVLGILMVVFLVGVLGTKTKAEPLKKKINSDTFGVAIEGYDTVAYFTEGRAMKGKSEFSYNWNDASGTLQALEIGICLRQIRNNTPRNTAGIVQQA